jgi:hypothetical protein
MNTGYLTGRVGSPRPPLPIDVAQICLSGHVRNERYLGSPQFNEDFCATCGRPTITACPACKKQIPGARAGMHGFVSATANCTGCGKEFPWTEEATRASIELFLDELKIQGEEAQQLEQSVRDLVQQTPSAPLATSRLKRWGAKLNSATQSLVMEALKAVVAKAALETIFPTP